MAWLSDEECSKLLDERFPNTKKKTDAQVELVAQEYLCRHIKEVIKTRGTEHLTLNDLLVSGLSLDGKRMWTRVVSPIRCTGCNGYTSFFAGPGATVKRADLAMKIKVFSDGMMRSHFLGDVVQEDSQVCDCEQRIEELEKLLATYPKIVEDSGWKDASTSIHERGIHDFQRRIKYERELTAEQLENVVSWLARKDCPGYTGITVHRSPGFSEYTFSTCWDSSD
jgi:hypothetical protein